MHNHNGKNDSWMMWVMMICCILPLILLVLFGLGGKSLGAPTWLVLGAIAVMVIIHFISMGRSHKHLDKEQIIADDGNNNKDNKDRHS